MATTNSDNSGTWSMRRRFPTWAVLLGIGLLGGWGAGPVDAELYLGPVQGLTTEWHPAPAVTSVPLGAAVELKQRLGSGVKVRWVAADGIWEEDGWSVARYRFENLGRYLAIAEITHGNGTRREERCVFDVEAVSPEDVQVSRVDVSVDPVELDAPGTSTYEYFRLPSIAGLTKVGKRRYRTSVSRSVTFEVEVEPPGFRPLVEWRYRVDGRISSRLGPTLEITPTKPGFHFFRAGPEDRFESVLLETYRVLIVSHMSGRDVVHEGVPVTFRARTEPEGFEEEIVWIASTLFGDSDPVLGQGEEFTVTFRDTFGGFGTWPGGRQWLGVRGANAVFDQDQKAEVWTPFDPATDFPDPPGSGEPIVETLDCLPATIYDPVTQSILLREGPFTRCPDERFCVRQDDGTYAEVSEAAATQDGCDALESTICPDTLFDGSLPPQTANGARAGCDALQALPAGICEQVEICPDDGDVPRTASETADPPAFPELEPLPPLPRNPPPGVVTLVDNLTRFIPPCFWDDAQSFADVFRGPVPAFGDDQSMPTRIDDDATNFVGLPDGAPCLDAVECRSNLCGVPCDVTDPGCIPAPVCNPRVRLDKDVRTNKGQRINDLYFRQKKGNERWNVEVATGLYAADAHAQGLFYPSVAWDIRAGAEVRVGATAAGKTFDDLVVLDMSLQNGHCSFAHSSEVRIFDLFEDFDGFELGLGGVFVEAGSLGNEADQVDPVLEQDCEAAFQRLRALERSTNERLWDVFMAAALWNSFGPSGAVPDLATGQSVIDNYTFEVAEYSAALGDYRDKQLLASNHAFGTAIVDLDAGLSLGRPARIEHRMGPFVLGAEIGVVGKAGVDVLVKSATDFSADPGDADVAVGVEITPHADVRGYVSIFGGVDLFLAEVQAGIQGELAFAGIYAPMVASAGLVRDEIPLDQSPIGVCIPDPTLAMLIPGYDDLLGSGQIMGLPCPNDPATRGLPIFGNLPTPLIPPTGAAYRVPFGYNVGVQGRFLNGRIKAFLRAQLSFFFHKTWTKTLAEWQGLERTYLTVVDGADIFADSFSGSSAVLDFGLPTLGDSIQLWPGPQRDMVYLPDMSGSFALPGTLDPSNPLLEPFFDYLNENLQRGDRWDRSSGFCSSPQG